MPVSFSALQKHIINRNLNFLSCVFQKPGFVPTLLQKEKKMFSWIKNQECSCMTQYQLSFWLVSWDWFSFHTLPQVGVRSVILRLLSSIIWLFVNTQSAGDFNSFCLANTLSIFYGEYPQFGFGISLRMGPKKHNFWPKINNLKKILYFVITICYSLSNIGEWF